MDVIVYTKNVCGGCETVISYLEQNGVVVEERNIEDHDKPEHMEQLIETGFRSVPIVVTSNNVVEPFSGFEMAELDQIIAAYNK